VAKRPESRARTVDPRLTSTRWIGGGIHADIWLSEDGREVYKLYRARDVESARALARLEFETLERVADLLKQVPGVNSPAPIAIAGDSGELRMEFCPGIPLHQALGTPVFSRRDVLQDVASRLAGALSILADQLSAEQVDTSGRANILYDPDEDRIVFLDFTKRVPPVAVDPHVTPLENISGSLLAGLLTVILEKSAIANPRKMHRITTFTRILAASQSHQDLVSFDSVRTVAWQYFWHRSRSGGMLRRLWLSTAGAVVFAILLRYVLRPPARPEGGQAKDS
jgi:hypothetical protein